MEGQASALTDTIQEEMLLMENAISVKEEGQYITLTKNKKLVDSFIAEEHQSEDVQIRQT